MIMVSPKPAVLKAGHAQVLRIGQFTTTNFYHSWKIIKMFRRVERETRATGIVQLLIRHNN